MPQTNALFIFMKYTANLKQYTQHYIFFGTYEWAY